MKQLPLLSLLCLLLACQAPAEKQSTNTEDPNTVNVVERLNIYTNVRLTTDLSKLTEAEKKMIPILIEAAKIMDNLFAREAYPPSVKVDESELGEATKAFMKINYGPWDRLDGNKPFVPE